MKLHRVSITLEGRANETLFLSPYVQFQLHDLTYLKVVPVSLEINQGTFTVPGSQDGQLRIGVSQTDEAVEFTCPCDTQSGTLCEHQLLVLTAIARREELSVFFQKNKRHEAIRKIASEYGLDQEEDLDNHFWIRLEDKKLAVSPRVPGLLRVSMLGLEKIQQELFPSGNNPYRPNLSPSKERIIVFRKHKYYQHLQVGLFEVFFTRQGTIKNPVTEADPHELAWHRENSNLLRFFMAMSRFQGFKETGIDEGDLRALNTIVTEHPGYRMYVHQEHISDQITAASLMPVKVSRFKDDCILSVVQKGNFMELSMKLKWDGQVYALKDFDLRFGCFLIKSDEYRLVDHLPLFSVINYFRKQHDPLRVHINKFRDFQRTILDKIQDIVLMEYLEVKPGTPRQIEARAHHLTPEKIIYLSDSGNYVHLLPVICYGEIEIPIRTKRMIFDHDEKGKPFQVRRNEDKEIAFTALLIRQHPDLNEQLENSLPYFYLHKRYFLDETWFLPAFEEWRDQGIQILGFNELEGNRINAEKASVTVQVGSGINWFNTEIDVKFGKKRAKLKHLQAAIVNKRKYVELDDGTLGILPSEWLERFRQFFENGEISKEDSLHIPWVNFSAIEKYFDREMLEEDAWQRLKYFKDKLSTFEHIEKVEVPSTFQGTLRDYQQTGLNWLNFLDQCNFGGCLADDMGLGKSAQMIALMLLQKERLDNPTNLIVMPTSLLYNWQEEIGKFAASLSVLVYNGINRTSKLATLSDYDIVLISYNTVIADCAFLKKFCFNTIVLDESQYIKNPDTLRYKSVALLQARNRFVMTGTPIENHTSDLYSQLSFACPGLLGSKRAFKELYSAPIDQFKDQKRTKELQHKIKPFVLRRTKNDVAPELPDKTELVLYCEMQPWQRKIYEAYEKEFREFIDATSGDELRKDPMHVLKGLTQLRQICNSPSLIKGVQIPENQLAAKLEVLMDKVNETVQGHKILIFSQFVSMLDIISAQLTEQGIGHTSLTGATRNRQHVINEFRNNQEARVFLISLKAGGTGLTLTEADYVFLVDPWWNPAVEAQAIDRVYRIGQHKKVIAVRLICRDTVEEKMMSIQENKKQLADSIIQEDSSGLASFSKDDLLSLLR